MGALKDQITTEFRPWLPGAEAHHAGHAVQVARRQPDAELLIELQRLNNNKYVVKHMSAKLSCCILQDN